MKLSIEQIKAILRVTPKDEILDTLTDVELEDISDDAIRFCELVRYFVGKK